jgi:phospholipid/cholesterol/gamma-HCH transport system substrate-binding protein
MERDANYKLVGAFTLIGFIVLGFFIFWLGKYGVEEEKYHNYKTQVNQSVAGLKRSSPVMFKGIEVVFVESIRFHPHDPQTIEIEFKVDKTVPIKRDTVVLLNTQGISGMGYLELQGGSLNAPNMGSVDQRFELASQSSMLSKMIDNTDKLMTKTNSILTKIDTIMSPKMVDNLSVTLQNLSESSQKFNQGTLDELSKSAKSTQEMIKETKLMATDARSLISDVKKELHDASPAQQFNATMRNTNELLGDTKRLISTSTQFVEELKESPSDLLFKSKKVKSPSDEQR